MKKLLFFLGVLFVPAAVAAGAEFERDLYFGIKNDSEVGKLQEFLSGQGLYSGPITGNFFVLTREAVRKFQEREKIEPVLGFFGPKTRAKANPMLFPAAAPVQAAKKSEEIAAEIRALQLKLAELQAKLEEEKKVLPQPAAPSPSPQPVSLPLNLEIKGGQAASVFPETASVSFKIGEITVSNGAASEILFSQIVLALREDLNSFLNRGREIYFVLRDGTSTAAEITGRTSLIFNSTVPEAGSKHSYELGLSYPVKIKSGEKKIAGLWIDNLEFVSGGTMEIEFKKVLATTSVVPSGTFLFRLTK